MEAVVEPLQLLDLLEVLLVLAAHEVEPRLALAQIGREVAALRLHVLVLHGEHAPPDLLEQAAVVGDEHEGTLVVGEERLEPLHRVDVEVVGRLVQQEEVGVGEERARQGDARELAAREGEQAALQHVVREAEALDDPAQAVAIPVASGSLEAPLQLLIRLHRVAQLRAVLGEAGEPLLGRAQRGLELDGLPERLEEVLAHQPVPLEFGVCSCSQILRPRARAIVPESACSSPETRRSSVVLPVPLRPTSTAWSCPSTENDTVVNNRCPANDFSTLLKVMMLMAGPPALTERGGSGRIHRARRAGNVRCTPRPCYPCRAAGTQRRCGPS